MSGFDFSPARGESSTPRLSSQAQLPLADAARVLEPGPQYWLSHEPDPAAMRPHELMREFAAVEQWLRRQSASTPEVLRMEQVRDEFHGALTRLGHKAMAKPKKTRPAKGAKSDSKPAAPGAAAPRPRMLREHSSRATDEPGDLDAEYDDIVEGLQRDDLSPQDRGVLQTELANLSPSMAQTLAQEAAQRQAERVSGALAAPANAQGRVDAQDIAKRIDSIRPLPGHPGQNYLMSGHEMLVIPDAQLKAIRASVMSSLESQAHHIQYGTQQVQADLAEFVDRTYDWSGHPYVGFLSIVGSGENPLHWDEQIMPFVAESNRQIGRLRALQSQARDPWGDPHAPLAPMADALARADVQGDAARYAFDSRQGKMFEATASQVKVLKVAKGAGQLAANFAFTPAAAALYTAVEESAVQGLEVHYGQRDSVDITGILIDTGSSYLGAKVGGGVMGLAGKEASTARQLAFFVAGDRAGAVASSATWMGLNNAAGRTNFSASDFAGVATNQLLDVPQVVEDYALGKVTHGAESLGRPKAPRMAHGSDAARGAAPEAPVARPEAPNVTPEAPAARAQPGAIVAGEPALPGAAALPQIPWQPIPAPVEAAPKAPAPARPGAAEAPATTTAAPPAGPPRTTTKAQWKAQEGKRRWKLRVDEAFDRLDADAAREGDEATGVEVPRTTGGTSDPRIEGRPVPGPREPMQPATDTPQATPTTGEAQQTTPETAQAVDPNDGRRHILDMQHLPRGENETGRQAVARVRTVIGRKLSDFPHLESLWNDARRSILSRDTLTEDNYGQLYERTRKAFWRRVRGNTPEGQQARALLDGAGFELRGGKTSAPRLATEGEVFKADLTLSLDHVEEKGQGQGWQKALDADNLSMEFAAPNSERENKQQRHPELRGAR